MTSLFINILLSFFQTVENVWIRSLDDDNPESPVWILTYGFYFNELIFCWWIVNETGERKFKDYGKVDEKDLIYTGFRSVLRWRLTPIKVNRQSIISFIVKLFAWLVKFQVECISNIKKKIFKQVILKKVKKASLYKTVATTKWNKK